MAHLTDAVPLGSSVDTSFPHMGLKERDAEAVLKSLGEEVCWLHSLRKAGNCEADRGHKGRWCPLVQVLNQERLGMLGDLLM